MTTRISGPTGLWFKGFTDIQFAEFEKAGNVTLAEPHRQQLQSAFRNYQVAIAMYEVSLRPQALSEKLAELQHALNEVDNLIGLPAVVFILANESPISLIDDFQKKARIFAALAGAAATDFQKVEDRGAGGNPGRDTFLAEIHRQFLKVGGTGMQSKGAIAFLNAVCAAAQLQVTDGAIVQALKKAVKKSRKAPPLNTQDAP